MTPKKQNVAAIIPARYNSTRFPGKALAQISGKPMIQWVYESTMQSDVQRTIVATDDHRILECVENFGGEAIITSEKHETGTDRIYEVLSGLNQIDTVINVQGDEPLISPEDINGLIAAMSERKDADMGTIAVPIKMGSPNFKDPNAVKVVVDKAGFALYFSRSPIPYFRDSNSEGFNSLMHWGIYAYRKEFLERFVRLPQSCLEKAEKLEQLRALENGAKIFVTIGTGKSVGVDVPEDIKRVEAILDTLSVVP